MVADEAVESETRSALCIPLANLVSNSPPPGPAASDLLPALLCGTPGAATLRSAIQKLRQAFGVKEINATLSSLLSQENLTQQVMHTHIVSSLTLAKNACKFVPVHAFIFVKCMLCQCRSGPHNARQSGVTVYDCSEKIGLQCME